MMLKLYGKPMSTCTLRVEVVLKEKNIPYEFFEVPWDEMKTPEYLSKSPFGLVPYLDDDGLILYESRAICRYIEAKYSDREPKLIPTEPLANALFEQAASFESATFEPFATGAFVESCFKPFLKKGGDRTVFDKNIESLAVKLHAYEIILGKQKYIAGDELTLVDLFHLPCGTALGIAGSDIMYRTPNVARWFNDISSRESWSTLSEEMQQWKGSVDYYKGR